MAVSRHNDGISVFPRDLNDFVRWLFLSVAIHAVLAAVVVISQSVQKKIFYTPAYEVELLPMPGVVKPEEVPQKEVVLPREQPKKEKVKKRASKRKKPAPSPKAVKNTARPEEAVARIREKIAAEEAVDRMRRKVKEKETTSREITIAARAPARVYHYEELDAELRAYFEKISLMINGAWSLPEALRNKGFKTILSIHIRRDGTIESLWIEEGSGNKFYDESALRAINKVPPLPPLPKRWKEEAIDLGLRF